MGGEHPTSGAGLLRAPSCRTRRVGLPRRRRIKPPRCSGPGHENCRARRRKWATKLHGGVCRSTSLLPRNDFDVSSVTCRFSDLAVKFSRAATVPFIARGGTVADNAENSRYLHAEPWGPCFRPSAARSAQEADATARCLTDQFKGKRQGPGTEIKDITAAELFQFPGRHPTPVAVDLHTEKRIQEIILRTYGSEFFFDKLFLFFWCQHNITCVL